MLSNILVTKVWDGNEIQNHEHLVAPLLTNNHETEIYSSQFCWFSSTTCSCHGSKHYFTPDFQRHAYQCQYSNKTQLCIGFHNSSMLLSKSQTATHGRSFGCVLSFRKEHWQQSSAFSKTSINNIPVYRSHYKCRPVGGLAYAVGHLEAWTISTQRLYSKISGRNFITWTVLLLLSALVPCSTHKMLFTS